MYVLGEKGNIRRWKSNHIELVVLLPIIQEELNALFCFGKILIYSAN